MNAVIRDPEVKAVWDVFDGFLRPSRFSAVNGQALRPAIDLVETDGTYLVKAELPGVKKEDLDVTIQDGVLTISAESNYDSEDQKDGRMIRQERRFGKYVRSMRLGDIIDEAKIQAEYKDGLLELTLPKAEVAKPKKVDIKVQ